MTYPFPFGPQLGETVSISATDTSGSTTISMNHGGSLVVTNSGSSLCYISFGQGSAPTATTSDYPVLATSQQTITVPEDVTHVAAICESGDTTTVKFSPGEGL